jgi:anti-sigma B factor antagonist
MEQPEIIGIDSQQGVTIVTFLVPSISTPADVESVSAKLRPLADDPAQTKMIVDFDGVKFFSSMVLGLLVDIWKKLKEKNGTLIISGINPQLSRVFKITNLDKLFQFYPDRQSALNAINAI